ncbi:MAG: SDR family oxidoreductase [Bacteroidales bacterium]|nr:SDR family oxidoreductase [Bacteroidales bacterium]
MTVFVSGATGFIGIQLVKRLAGMGITIHALYRSDLKADLIRVEGVKLFKGDILDETSLLNAMEGCEFAYHTAAFAGVWSKDPGMVYQLNVDGSLNVIRAAEKCGIRRLVVTSTAGILGPSEKEAVDENSLPPTTFFTTYEESKFQLEKKLLGRTEANPEVVVVNPTRVYGPGYLSESNGVTKMIKQYIEGKWRFIPGNGENSGNYVFVEDVVTGHLLAMEKGNPGERYVLGGENISYNQLFQYTREASGIQKRLYKIPLWIMLTAASLMKLISKLTGRPPMIVPNLVRKFNHNWMVSSEKAIRELGYQPMGAKEGVRRTIEWLNQF